MKVLSNYLVYLIGLMILFLSSAPIHAKKISQEQIEKDLFLDFKLQSYQVYEIPEKKYLLKLYTESYLINNSTKKSYWVMLPQYGSLDGKIEPKIGSSLGTKNLKGNWEKRILYRADPTYGYCGVKAYPWYSKVNMVELKPGEKIKITLLGDVL